MTQYLFIAMLMVFGSNALANKIFTSKDWSVYKDVETALLKKGCVAETIVESDKNGVMEKWFLQVVLLKSDVGSFSEPVVISYPENKSDPQYFEATAQSDKNQSPLFSMTLLQPSMDHLTVVGSRINDREELIARLKSDNKMKINFLDKNGTVKSLDFSLQGSSKTLSTLLSQCH